jgi:hypothetical protein
MIFRCLAWSDPRSSFVLEPEDVDRLRAAAKKILTHSKEFQDLVEDLQ